MIRETIKVVVVGHVDDGKSTLIGRLLYETDSLADGKLKELETASQIRGMPMEWSFALDAFQAERDQAITIDKSQVTLKTAHRNITLIDAPGHIEFLKNMVSAAANADGACLLVDATAGVRQQTCRHSYLLTFLGIQQVVVIINKMDLIDFSQARFEEVSTQVLVYLEDVGIKPTAIIPVSAREGDLLIQRSENMTWYEGPSVLDAINNFKPSDAIDAGFLRFPVQDVYKFDERRIIAGKIESGCIQVGDMVLLSPSNQTAKVCSIDGWCALPKFIAKAKESVGITLDKPLFVERGDLISHLQNPPLLTAQFRATLFWLGNTCVEQGQIYKIKLATREAIVTIQSVEYEINTDSLKKIKSSLLEKNQCGEVIIQARDLIPLDDYRSLRNTGRFVLMDNQEIVAGGMISMRGFSNQRKSALYSASNLTKVTHYVTKTMREQRYGYKGGVLWLTGLSGAGKSTLAMASERLLFLTGCQVYVLDGDNIRSGLNDNLTFSPEDRAENIRRIGEVAALFADAGFICITSFISPYKADRDKVRKMVAAGDFHEVYIRADLENCERRDPKGLYKKAREGVIDQFTGISAPYEVPIDPELIIDTVNLSIDDCVHQLVEYAKVNFSNNNAIKKSKQVSAQEC